MCENVVKMEFKVENNEECLENDTSEPFFTTLKIELNDEFSVNNTEAGASTRVNETKPSRPNKRNILSLEKKIQLIEEIDRNEQSRYDIAKHYDISLGALSSILGNREKIFEAHNSNNFHKQMSKIGGQGTALQPDKNVPEKKEPRRVFNLTLERKVELIAAVEKGKKSRRELAKKFGIAPSTLTGIMINKTMLIEAFHNQTYNPERRKFRKPRFEDLEKELLKCVSIWQAEKNPFNGPKLVEKANEIAKKLEITEFSGSNGWIERFKHRNNIKFIPSCESRGDGEKKDPRRVVNLTLEKKAELIAAVEKGNKSRRELAKKFGIAPSTLTGIMINKTMLMEAFHSQTYNPERKKFRKSCFNDLDKELLKCVLSWQAENMPLTGPKLLERANEIATELNITDFSGSNGWIDRFKTRNNIKFGPSLKKKYRKSVDLEEKGLDNLSESYDCVDRFKSRNIQTIQNKSDSEDTNDSQLSSIISSDESAPPTPDTTDSTNNDVPTITKQIYDSMEGRPEFQNIFKKHKCRDQYRKYTQEQLMEACKYAIETRASYREVSEKFGIPQSTLRDKLHAVEKLNADGQPPIKKSRVDTPKIQNPCPESNVVLCPEFPENDLNRISNGVNDRVNYRQYSKDSLMTAAHYVMKFNTPIMKAARMFGVPPSTLKDHVKNKIPANQETVVPPTNSSLISDRDERKLIEYIKMMEKCGFILTQKEIIDFGSELASASREIDGSITLSDSWYLDFVKRWPPLGLVNRERRNSTPQDTKKYFTELNKVFNKHKFFERPELVYVLEEVDIALECNPLRLVPGKRFNQSKGTRQTLTSVIGCSNALGTTLPPYYVLQSDEVVSEVISQCPTGAQATFANSVSKDCSVVRDYFQNHFMRFAQSGRNTQNRFVLVFYDSRKSNFNVSDLEWAKRWHILLHPLPHPVKKEAETMDGIFRNYCVDVEEARSNFVEENGYMAVSMPDICGILGKAYRRSLTYEHIISCFENFGIYPLNPQKYVAQLESSIQVKLHDLHAVPNYETNLWLLSDFGCTQAVNNAIESSLNSSYTNDSNTQNSNFQSENSSKYSGHNNKSGILNYHGSRFNQDTESFSTSHQRFPNHLMEQGVDIHLQEPQLVNGIAIKSEPQMDLSYGQTSVESYPQNDFNYLLSGTYSSAQGIPTNTRNILCVPQFPQVERVPTSLSDISGTQNISHISCSQPDSNTTTEQSVISSETIPDRSKHESSSSSRRKGKSHRIIVNEFERESENSTPSSVENLTPSSESNIVNLTPSSESSIVNSTPSTESNIIFSKSKIDNNRKISKLGSLLDEKVRKLHEQAKASSESNDDNDEPLMKVGEFQIVMNKGD